jgi:LPXTG-site transpeptidase (sortase) family protein
MEEAEHQAAQSEDAWKAHYAALSDEGKRQMWHDYYEHLHVQEPDAEDKGRGAGRHGSVIVSQISAMDRQFFSLKNQLRSMAFGLACGVLVVMAFSFTVFNEVIIAPFIRPNQSASQGVVADQTGVLTDPSPKVVIPKINVDIPVVYGLPTTDEKQFELALDNGIVHYPTTALPGQVGNAAFFGHSSNNIFNPGKYKFAFVLLHELAPGDQFSLAYNSQLYTYQVISRQIVKPTEVGVLDAVAGQPATATLITCDPPGTSTNRLVVVGKQISPSLDGTVTPVAATPQTPSNTQSLDSSNLPGNGPGLLTRLWRSFFGG